MKNIYDLDFEQLEEIIISENIPKFRAKQIWKWLYQNLVTSFDQMTNVDKKTIEILKKSYEIENYEIVKHQKDEDKTEKILLSLSDDDVIETVLMKYKHGYCVCVTTQIGCKIGCSFCASHLGGFQRNLSTGEIVAQVIKFERILREIDERVGNIVIMGIGEPLDNLENVLRFIDVINHPDGLKIGARHITLSTSGIVPKIYELTKYPKQINLAISLHAPNDEIRSRIMKINDVYDIKMLMSAVDDYILETNRRVSFEYIMLKNINDQVEHAQQLAALVRGMNCHINLIPFNSVEEYTYEKSAKDVVREFEEVLLKKKIQVSVRQAKGNNIDGACGQLRYKHKNA